MIWFSQEKMKPEISEKSPAQKKKPGLDFSPPPEGPPPHVRPIFADLVCFHFKPKVHPRTFMIKLDSLRQVA